MSSPPVEKMLEQLIVVAENLSMGNYGDHDQLFAMTDSENYPPFISRFAEAFGMMAVKIEAREFRLEQIISDLTRTRDELAVSNERLKQSLLELQQAQMQLIQQEKMESVGRLAAGVAHEVKNPLAVIQLGVDFLENELKGNTVYHETVMDIADAVQRADAVIKGLLDFSRSDQLDLQSADIGRVIDDSLLLVRHELNSRHVTVETERDASLPQLLLDRNKLKQVFINLFINATHAMPDGGSLKITTLMHVVTDEDLMISGTASSRFAAGDRSVMVRIADTGTGIREEVMSKLFDPFFTTKPVGIGTGLGLSVTRKILELHQAVISLRNRADRQGAEAVILFKI
jgi:signal transduction histidine kinase